MVKPKLNNVEVDLWVHRGKIGITQPSLCLFHESASIGSPIFDALNELKNETWPALANKPLGVSGLVIQISGALT